MTPKHLDVFLNSNIGDNKNFKWKEALYLASMDVYVMPDEDIARNIIETANRMQSIRDILGKPIKVTSWYRPANYNKHIGGAKNSYHIQGLACDFCVSGMLPDAVREILLDFLDNLDIRMEDMPGASWVHVDLGVPNAGRRFFLP